MITLGIIGVVATMTIPTLVRNYQTKAWSTASTVFERKLDEAMKIMNTQGTLAGYSNTEAFVDELSKHLKIIKVCKNNKLSECISGEFGEAGGTSIDVATRETYEITPTRISSLKTAKDLGQSDWNTNTVGFQLANGSTGLLAYNPKCKEDRYNNQFSGMSCIAVVYDTSGFSKPNELNKDMRTANATLSGGSSCFFKINGRCVNKMAPIESLEPMTITECLGGEYNGSFEASSYAKSLGIDLCDLTANYGEDRYDRWASAVKACGGRNKLPSSEEMWRLVEYVYNQPTGTLYADGTEIRKSFSVPDYESRLSDLGLPTSGPYGYIFWTSDTPIRENVAKAFQFMDRSYIRTSDNTARDNNISAFCLE